jgi:hypothetical protein
MVNNVEYKVTNVKLSFEKEGDIVYYDFIVVLKRNIEYRPIDESADDIYKRALEKILEKEERRKKFDKYDKYDYYKKMTNTDDQYFDGDFKF